MRSPGPGPASPAPWWTVTGDHAGGPGGRVFQFSCPRLIKGTPGSPASYGRALLGSPRGIFSPSHFSQQPLPSGLDRLRCQVQVCGLCPAPGRPTRGANGGRPAWPSPTGGLCLQSQAHPRGPQAPGRPPRAPAKGPQANPMQGLRPALRARLNRPVPPPAVPSPPCIQGPGHLRSREPGGRDVCSGALV